MRRFAQCLAVCLLATTLVACDNNSENTGSSTSAAATQNGKAVSLLNGKLSFTLPAGLSDSSDLLTDPTSNRHVYSDASAQQLLIVLFSENTTKPLDDLMQELLAQQQARDANLQVITNNSFEINGKPFHRLDSVISDAGQQYYSSVVMGRVDNQLMTWQMLLPAKDQQQAQTAVEQVLTTMKVME